MAWTKTSQETRRWTAVQYDAAAGFHYSFGHGKFGHFPFGHGGWYGGADPWDDQTKRGLYYGFGVGGFGRGRFGGNRGPVEWNKEA